MLRRRKGSETSKTSKSESQTDIDDDEKKEKERAENSEKREKKLKNWSCVDSCCWFIGCICSIWWFLLFMFNAMPASFPQYVTEAITGPLQDPPGVKLQKEGLKANHPVVFVPGIVTGGLELWEGHQCAEGLFRKRLWGGTFGEIYKRYQLYSIGG
ncbi:Phospholipid:diacylglycerol acyltransferase 1 [Sarracenia purpurea var. burkii]